MYGKLYCIEKGNLSEGGVWVCIILFMSGYNKW